METLTSGLVRQGFLLDLWGAGIWISGTSVAAWVAWEKGRDPVAWFVVGLFLSPRVSLIALGAIPARHLARGRREMKLEDPVVVAARIVNGVESKRWEVATSAATSTRRRW